MRLETLDFSYDIGSGAFRAMEFDFSLPELQRKKLKQRIRGDIHILEQRLDSAFKGCVDKNLTGNTSGGGAQAGFHYRFYNEGSNLSIGTADVKYMAIELLEQE